MARIEWNASFSVNNKEIDSQHKKLIEMYNNLHEALIQGTTEQTSNTKQETLALLSEYVVFHFATEEQYMQSIHYPGFDEHLESHTTLTRQIQRIQRDIENKSVILSTSILKILRNWITEHICEKDQEYARFKNAQ